MGMVGVIDGFRWSISRGQAPFRRSLALSLLTVALLLISSIWYFRKTERTFADVICPVRKPVAFAVSGNFRSPIWPAAFLKSAVASAVSADRSAAGARNALRTAHATV